MHTDPAIEWLVLDEFRLADDDDGAAVAEVIGASRTGREQPIPLLISVEDHRNVATIRGLRAGEPTELDAAQHAALDPFVTKWDTSKRYGPRITERSHSPSAHYRLAVTESGMNDSAPAREERRGSSSEASFSDIGLLWIGTPVGTHAGLLVLLGTHERSDGLRAGVNEWPLPLSRTLGVRIYESRAHIKSAGAEHAS